MAQIQNNKSIYMDMTPLVDLAFLLLTFFILTATFNKPSVLKLTYPPKNTKGVYEKNNGITIFIEGNNINYNEGSLNNNTKSVKSTTNLILDLARIKKAFDMKNKKLFVIIKPNEQASYQRVINVLDALSINGINNYEIQDY